MLSCIVLYILEDYFFYIYFLLKFLFFQYLSRDFVEKSRQNIDNKLKRIAENGGAAVGEVFLRAKPEEKN